MPIGLSSESAQWILPSNPITPTPSSPTYEQALPFRVNQEGVKNYMKNRGSLNIGEWAIEGQRPSSSSASHALPIEEPYGTQPKVIGPDAMRNYSRSRNSTPNLIYGAVETPNAHSQMRVKQEGLANYERNHNSDVKSLLQNYGKMPLQQQPIPHTQGEMATTLFYSHQEGQMGSILNPNSRMAPSPRPIPHVKGEAAEMNLQRGLGDSQLLEHGVKTRMPTPEPHLKGSHAQFNYDEGQGHHINELFHQYGKLPQSVRSGPKVKYDGLENRRKGQGDEMRKALAQCPPTSRPPQRPPSAPYWP